MVTWDDHRSGTDWEIYAQRVDYNGGIKPGGLQAATWSVHIPVMPHMMIRRPR